MTERKETKMKRARFKVHTLGRLGTWLCDRFQPRPCTKLEIANSQQYAKLMIDVLTGECPFFGRDRERKASREEGVQP